MALIDEFRDCLERGDFHTMRQLWARVATHLPQPEDDAAAEASLHMARTQANSLALRLRAYSHRWLTERGLPSQLPETLRAPAERLYPQIVEAVGISINSSNDHLKPLAKEAERRAGIAVEEMYADGDTDPEVVKKRIQEVKTNVMRSAIGRLFHGSEIQPRQEAVQERIKAPDIPPAPGFDFVGPDHKKRYEQSLEREAESRRRSDEESRAQSDERRRSRPRPAKKAHRRRKA